MVIDGDMEGVVNESVDPSSVNLVVHEVPEVRRALFRDVSPVWHYLDIQTGEDYE